MIRRLLASVFLAAFPVVVIPIAVTSMGARAGAAPPTAVQQCKDGGWRTLTDASGQPFKNQGQCISYFIHSPVTLADLTGPFSGTTSFALETASCSLAEQSFDATYPGSSAVGSVTLHLVGCANPATAAPPGIEQSQFTYTGTFTIATTVGTLAGVANGPVYAVFPTPVDFELTLTVLSGTGAFAGTTGTIHASIQWCGCGAPGASIPVTGSVTVP